MFEALAVMMLFMLFMFALMVSGIVLWIWAFVNVLNVPHDSMLRSGSKLLWAVIVGLGGPVGAIIYLALGKPQAARGW